MVLKFSSVILVCVGTLFVCVGAQRLSRDYGVKLCGREFIRAVIFTCGGSRWRRSLSEDLDPFHSGLYSDIKGEDSRFNWLHSLNQAADQPFQFSSSTSLADLIILGGGENQRGSVTDVEPSIELQNHASELEGVMGPGGPDRSRSVNWPRRVRRKRNFSVGVAGMCCNLGCTKNDIGRLC
ncbi:hypothetical protein DPEC_G00332950 [Dallia pectoralis]|uniref:Uncharacterized protein n=1 Tax=Dallia pectoralis TaxID=75939 RepID=A0ACC2F695_DALPE|nr:hypothetical protein DPEC_G00332950 [Dallia pectoralis]